MISSINGKCNNLDMIHKVDRESNIDNKEKFTVNTPCVLQPNTILSTIHLETGESIGINYDETSTSSAPIMLARIIEPDGNVNEVKVDVNKVDPNHASYVEMVALSAYLKTEGKIDGPAGILATMVFNSKVKDTNNVYSKADYVSGMKEMMDDILKNRQMDTYLRYIKELNIMINWGIDGKR